MDVATQTQTTQAILQMPPHPTLTRRTRVKTTELIPLDEKAFCYHKDGRVRGDGKLGRSTASSKAESRAVLAIVKVINKDSLNDKQKVQALRKASTHKDSRHIFHSAGLVDVKEYETMKHGFNSKGGNDD